MTKYSRHQYFAQGMLQIANYFGHQLGMPDNEIDGTVFLSAFSHILEGKRIKEGPWKEGPCHEASNTNDIERLRIAEEWAALVHKRGRVIPNIARTGTGRVINIVKQGGLRGSEMHKTSKGRSKREKMAKIICSFCGQQGLKGRQQGQ